MNSALTDHKIMEPYAYILELPGKNVRGKLIEAFQLWLKAPPEAEETIQTIVDELHNASLLWVFLLF
jgi:geranylgeranyl diphosphate synthase type 3